MNLTRTHTATIFQKEAEKLINLVGVTKVYHVFSTSNNYPEGSLYQQAKLLIQQLGYSKALDNVKVSEWKMPDMFGLHESEPEDFLWEHIDILQKEYVLPLTHILTGRNFSEKNWEIISQSIAFNPEEIYSDECLYGKIQTAYKCLGIDVTYENTNKAGEIFPSSVYMSQGNYLDHSLYKNIQETYKFLIGDPPDEQIGLPPIPPIPTFEEFEKNPIIQKECLYAKILKTRQTYALVFNDVQKLKNIIGTSDDSFSLNGEYPENSLYGRIQSMIKTIGIDTEIQQYLTEQNAKRIEDLADDFETFWENIIKDKFWPSTVSLNESPLKEAILEMSKEQGRLIEVIEKLKGSLKKHIEIMGLRHLNEHITSYIKGKEKDLPNFDYDDNWEKIGKDNTLYSNMKLTIARFLGVNTFLVDTIVKEKELA
jgi:hypothetical protein